MQMHHTSEYFWESTSHLHIHQKQSQNCQNHDFLHLKLSNSKTNFLDYIEKADRSLSEIPLPPHATIITKSKSNEKPIELHRFNIVDSALCQFDIRNIRHLHIQYRPVRLFIVHATKFAGVAGFNIESCLERLQRTRTQFEVLCKTGEWMESIEARILRFCLLPQRYC